MFLLLLLRALRLYRMESHHPPEPAVTAAMDKRRHTVFLWNVFIRMMRVAVNNEIWKNSCNVNFRHSNSTCFADDGIRRVFYTVW